MDFQIVGLDVDQFGHLYGEKQAVLSGQGIERITVDDKPGFPCRVSLRDVEVGETVLLMNYLHQPAASPYRSSQRVVEASEQAVELLALEG